jgi:hypothetical protein
MINQSYNCAADVVEASGDQGQAFFLNSFGIHQYENTGYELIYDASFIEQSQVFMQNSFGDYSSHANYDSSSNGEGLQFSQDSFMIYNDDYDGRSSSTMHSTISSVQAIESHISKLA